MRQVIAEVSIVPIGTGDTSLSRYVAACLDVLEGRADVVYEVTPMGTVLQGEMSVVLDLVQKMSDVPFGMGAKRVVTTLKIDDRRDKAATLDSKVRSVMRQRPKPKPRTGERYRTMAEMFGEAREEEQEPIVERPHKSF